MSKTPGHVRIKSLGNAFSLASTCFMSVALKRGGNVLEFHKMLFSNYALQAISMGSGKILHRENARIPWAEKWEEDDRQREIYKHSESLITSTPSTATGQGQGQGSGAPLPSASVCHQPSKRAPARRAASPRGTLGSHTALGCYQLRQDRGLAHGPRLRTLSKKPRRVLPPLGHSACPVHPYLLTDFVL